MRIKHLIVLLSLISRISYGQNLNMVIQVNDRLVTTEISGAYLNFESIDGTKDKKNVVYQPGELILEDEILGILRSDSVKNITLTFDYNSFKSEKHQIANYRVDMENYHFNQPYLILNIYDFRERKYRKRFSCLTDNDFIAELYFAQSGILIECK